MTVGLSDNLQVEGWIKTSFLDYPGGVCSTVFLAGCDFRCPYCHNPGLVLWHPALRPIGWEEVLRRLSLRVGLLDAVCFSGGEPTLRGELPRMLESVKLLGFKVKLDTNGSRPGVLRRVLGDGLVDYIAMDVKAPLDKYEIVCGVPVDLPAIEESARIVMESEVPYEFRTTAHPQLLEVTDFARIGKWLSGARRYVIQACRTGVNLDPVFRGLKGPSGEWLMAVEEQCRLFLESVQRIQQEQERNENQALSADGKE